MSIKIGNNDITDVKLGNTQVNSIYLGSTKVWEKAVDPYADFLSLSEGNNRFYDNTDSSINMIGFEIPNQSFNKYKVYWRIIYPSLDINTGIITFPYKKGSSSSASLSKIGIGTYRTGNSTSTNPSTGSAVYGIEFTNGMDVNSYKYVDNPNIYGGSFEITPGSSSSYPIKCVGLLQLESLYPVSGGSMITNLITSYYKQYTDTNVPDMIIDGEKVKLPGNKVVEASLKLNEIYNPEIFTILLAIKGVS